MQNYIGIVKNRGHTTPEHYQIALSGRVRDLRVPQGLLSVGVGGLGSPHSALIVQGSAKRWALGCVNPASWLPLATGCEFTQSRDHSFAQPCRFRETWQRFREGLLAKFTQNRERPPLSGLITNWSRTGEKERRRRK